MNPSVLTGEEKWGLHVMTKFESNMKGTMIRHVCCTLLIIAHFTIFCITVFCIFTCWTCVEKAHLSSLPPAEWKTKLNAAQLELLAQKRRLEADRTFLSDQLTQVGK